MKLNTFLKPMGAIDLLDFNYLALSSNEHMKRENARRECSCIKSSRYINYEEQKMKKQMSIRDMTNESRGMIDTRTEDSE